MEQDSLTTRGLTMFYVNFNLFIVMKQINKLWVQYFSNMIHAN
jgi:hypothetical protein